METMLFSARETTGIDCHNCINYKKGDCFGNRDKSLCNDYKHSPRVSESEIKMWPEYCSGPYGTLH